MSEPKVTGDIRWIGDLERLELRDGDRFVLSLPTVLTAEQHTCIQAAWRDFVGGDAERFKLLVMDGGAKLGVINGEPT